VREVLLLLALLSAVVHLHHHRNSNHWFAQACLLHVLVLVLVEATVCMCLSGRYQYEVPVQMHDGIGDRMHVGELTAPSLAARTIHYTLSSRKRKLGSPRRVPFHSFSFSTLPASSVIFLSCLLVKHSGRLRAFALSPVGGVKLLGVDMRSHLVGLGRSWRGGDQVQHGCRCDLFFFFSHFLRIVTCLECRFGFGKKKWLNGFFFVTRSGDGMKNNLMNWTGCVC